jgi:peptidoglycan hydrolase CwlO-like protein
VNKLVAVLGAVIILLFVVCGVLFYQLDDLQNQNSALEGQVTEYKNQTGELQNQISELESQITECQNQTSKMKKQIDELEQQKLELQNQTLELESLIDKFTNRVNITQFSVSGFNPAVGMTI